MFDFAKTDFRTVATAIAGAALLSTLSLAAAIGPARAGTPITKEDWKANVEDKVADQMTGLSRDLTGDDYAITTMMIDLDKEGHVMDARVLRSSGKAGLDERALRRARAIEFPAMPTGKPVHLQMNMVFGRTQHAVDLGRAELDQQVAYASKNMDRSSNSDGWSIRNAGM